MSRNAKANLARARIKALNDKLLRVIDETFDKCQGMHLNSVEESDAYWEMSEQLMAIRGEMRAEPVQRKPMQD